MAVKLIDELPKLMMTSSPQHHNAFIPTGFMLTQYIYSCYKLKEVSKAVTAIHRMYDELQYYPNMVSVTQVISLLEANHEYEKSVEIFRKFVATTEEELDGQVDPLAPSQQGEKIPSVVVDLHGFNQVLSRAAIRSALWKLVDAKPKVSTNLVIITGKGINSKDDKVRIYIHAYIYVCMFIVINISYTYTYTYI